MTVLWRFYFIPVWFCSSLFISFLFHFLISCICSDWEPKLENVPSVYHQWPLVAHGAQKNRHVCEEGSPGSRADSDFYRHAGVDDVGVHTRPHSVAGLTWADGVLAYIRCYSCQRLAIHRAPPHPHVIQSASCDTSSISTASTPHPHHTTPLRHLLSNTLVNTQLCDSVRIT